MPRLLLQRLRYPSVCLLFITLVPLFSWAQENRPDYYPLVLPEPELLGSLDTLMVSGDFLNIRIRPSSGAAQILWAAQPLPQASPANGLQRIESVALSPALSISESQLIVRTESIHTRYSLDIQLPASWQYKLRVYGAGDIDTLGISGELTAWSSRGDITVLEQAGRVSLTAMDGLAKVQLLEGALTGSSAITMSYGEANNNALTVSLPENANSTIRVQARGSLESNIPSLQNERATAIEHDLNQFLEMRLNGGGAALILRNLQGDVHLLRTLAQ